MQVIDYVGKVFGVVEVFDCGQEGQRCGQLAIWLSFC